MCTHTHTRRHNNGALYTPREKKNLIPARNGKKRMEKWKSKCESEYKLPTQKLRGVSMSSCWVERGIDIHPPREEEPHHCLDCGYIESRQVIFPFFFSPSLTAIGEVEKLQIQIWKNKIKNIIKTFLCFKKVDRFFFLLLFTFPPFKKIFSSCVSYSKKKKPAGFRERCEMKEKTGFLFFVFNIFSVCVCVCILRVVRL
jgi:hypothetical protein